MPPPPQHCNQILFLEDLKPEHNCQPPPRHEQDRHSSCDPKGSSSCLPPPQPGGVPVQWSSAPFTPAMLVLTPRLTGSALEGESSCLALACPCRRPLAPPRVAVGDCRGLASRAGTKAQPQGERVGWGGGFSSLQCSRQEGGRGQNLVAARGTGPGGLQWGLWGLLGLDTAPPPAPTDLGLSLVLVLLLQCPPSGAPAAETEPRHSQGWHLPCAAPGPRVAASAPPPAPSEPLPPLLFLGGGG